MSLLIGGTVGAVGVPVAGERRKWTPSNSSKCLVPLKNLGWIRKYQNDYPWKVPSEGLSWRPRTRQIQTDKNTFTFSAWGQQPHLCQCWFFMAMAPLFGEHSPLPFDTILLIPLYRSFLHRVISVEKFFLWPHSPILLCALEIRGDFYTNTLRNN